MMKFSVFKWALLILAIWAFPLTDMSASAQQTLPLDIEEQLEGQSRFRRGQLRNEVRQPSNDCLEVCRGAGNQCVTITGELPIRYYWVDLRVSVTPTYRQILRDNPDLSPCQRAQVRAALNEAKQRAEDSLDQLRTEYQGRETIDIDLRICLADRKDALDFEAEQRANGRANLARLFHRGRSSYPLTIDLTCDDEQACGPDQNSQSDNNRTSFPSFANTQARASDQTVSSADTASGDCDANGASYGDPHLITFDGYRYSFQTIGEFILARSALDRFEVQTRQEQVPGRQLTLNTAVAIRLGDNRIAYYARDFPGVSTSRSPLWIDGEPTRLRRSPIKLDQGSVSRGSGGRVIIKAEGGEEVSVAPSSFGDFKFLNVRVFAPEDRSHAYRGLLGNFDYSSDNDLHLRDGTSIQPKPAYGAVATQLNRFADLPFKIRKVERLFLDQLHKKFANSWRIASDQTLFDYGKEETTETYTDRDFPRTYYTFGSATPPDLRSAERTCREQGVSADFMEGCIFDVAATGDSRFAEATLSIIKSLVRRNLRDRVRRRLPIRIPNPE